MQKWLILVANLHQPLLSTRSAPLRHPNSARRLRPGISPGNTDLVPVQAGARTGLGPRTRFPSRCCAASAGLICPEIAPQYVQACVTRSLKTQARPPPKETLRGKDQKTGRQVVRQHQLLEAVRRCRGQDPRLRRRRRRPEPADGGQRPGSL